MSAAAKLLLCGRNINDIKEDINRIIKWDNGHNYDVVVYLNPGAYNKADHPQDISGYSFMDTPINLNEAIYGDLEQYIINRLPKHLTTKTGHNNDLYVVNNPEYEFEEGQ